MKTLLTISTALLSLAGFAQKTYLYCEKLIDVEKSEVLTEMTIVIEEDKILSVEKGYVKAGSEDKMIDLKSKTVMSGLMDMHVHLEDEWDKGRYTRVFKNNPADIAFNSAIYAKRTLMAGFTTVRDLGGTEVDTSLKNAIKRGVTDGSRIFSASNSSLLQEVMRILPMAIEQTSWVILGLMTE